MTDLTEQWKKGKLKEGEEYWVILTDEWYQRSPVEPVRAFYSCDCEFEGYLDDDIKEVLAPVPTYEEWQAKLEENERLKHDVGNLGYKIKNQRKEIERQIAQNAKLKELLKECVHYVNHRFLETRETLTKPYTASDKALHKKAEKLLQRIDEVLK